MNLEFKFSHRLHCYLGSGPLIIVLDLGAHADLADERRVLFAELHQDQFPVPPAEVFGRAHEEHVSTAGGETFSFTLLMTEVTLNHANIINSLFAIQK